MGSTVFVREVGRGSKHALLLSCEPFFSQASVQGCGVLQRQKKISSDIIQPQCSSHRFYFYSILSCFII